MSECKHENKEDINFVTSKCVACGEKFILTPHGLGIKLAEHISELESQLEIAQKTADDNIKVMLKQADDLAWHRENDLHRSIYIDSLEKKLEAKDEQIEAFRKHYSERLYRFSLNHERYKFIRDEENWSVDVDGINDWEILTELSLDEFDSHIDSCMEKAGWNYPIKAEADAAEALQSSKPSVDELMRLNMREPKSELIGRLLKEIELFNEHEVSAQDAFEFRRDQYGLNKREFCFVIGIALNHYGEFLKGKRELSKAVISRGIAIGIPERSALNFKKKES